MKTNTKLLRTALADVGRCIRGKVSAIMGHVKLSGVDSLKLEATNLDSWVTRIVPCVDTLGAMGVMLSHRKLSEVIANTFAEEVELKVEGNKVVIQGVGTTSIARLPIVTGDFQSAPTQGFTPLAVNPVELAEAIEAVAWAADKEDSARPPTKCICIDMKSNSLSCTTMTRTILLARWKKALICGDRRLMVEASNAPLLLPDLACKDAMVEASNNQLRIEHSGGSVVVRLSAAEALPFERIFAMRDGLKGAFVDREALRRGCLYAIMFTPPDKSPELHAESNGDNKLKLHAAHGDQEFSDEIEVLGNPIRFRLPANQLIGCLDKTMSDEVHVITKDNAVFVEIGDSLFAISQVAPPEAKEAK